MSATDNTDDDFPYENLVLRGGGAKTHAYIGALEVLEKRGKLGLFKRYAGASAGAMIAAYLALGADCKTLKQFSLVNFEEIAQDACCASMGCCGCLPMICNILRYYGWNSGDGMLNYFQTNIKTLCGDPNITFKQLYDKEGKELCVVTTNVTKMSVVYLHPKVSPDVPIAMALRMSIAIPGYFEPVKYRLDGQECYFVDGGLLCNYPIFCYDGWYLSMKPEDSFVRNLTDETKSPFFPVNKKTLGMAVHSAMESDTLKKGLTNRYGTIQTERPKSRLTKSRLKQVKRELERVERQARIVEGAHRVSAAIAAVAADPRWVTKEEAIKAIAQVEKTVDLEALMGKHHDPEEIFHKYDHNGDGRIHAEDFYQIYDNMKISASEIREGPAVITDISDTPSFFGALITAIMNSAERYYVKNADLDRTVGINTDYIATLDFAMGIKDREFLDKQSRAAMIAFLRMGKDDTIRYPTDDHISGQ